MQFFSSGHYGSNDFSTFYEAIPAPSINKASAVCGLLDIAPTTLTKYLTGKANPPKAMVRLLFHECHYGRQATDSHSHNGHIYALKVSQSLQSEVDRLKSTLQALELENQRLKQRANQPEFFAANSDRWRA